MDASADAAREADPHHRVLAPTERRAASIRVTLDRIRREVERLAALLAEAESAADSQL